MTFAKELFRQAKDQARLLFCTIDALCDDNNYEFSPEQQQLEEAAAYAMQALGCLFEAGKLQDEDTAEGES